VESKVQSLVAGDGIVRLFIVRPKGNKEEDGSESTRKKNKQNSHVSAVLV
jgi:hypothetical protein